MTPLHQSQLKRFAILNNSYVQKFLVRNEDNMKYHIRLKDCMMLLMQPTELLDTVDVTDYWLRHFKIG